MIHVPVVSPKPTPISIQVAAPSPEPQAPPTFEPIINAIKISAETESKVTGVTIYPTQAEVTRELKLHVVTGQNKVVVYGLSSSLDSSSLRIEGKGAGTIQGVSVSRMQQPLLSTTSPAIESLRERYAMIQSAIERQTLHRDAVCKYLETLTVQHVDAEKLSGILQVSEENLEKLDLKSASLKKELEALTQAINEEKGHLNPTINPHLRNQVEVGIFADREGEVLLVLKYAMKNATWSATYDARINTQANEIPLKLNYKAKITQSTGEDWKDVPILLETNTPTFNDHLPPLLIQQLSVKTKSKGVESRGSSASPYSYRGNARFTQPGAFPSPQLISYSEEYEERPPSLSTQIASVHSQGAMGTTFRIQGLVTIPSDNQPHNITIAELELDATLYWITVPKEDRRVHLQAKVKNTSEFVLLDGSVYIYVDGAFNSQSTISTANPQESLTFSLGLDPSIRVTYHPVIEKSSQSGLINKTTSKISTQHVTVQNTKLTPISTLKILVGVPVSNDARINVKLKSPNLSLPNSANPIQRTTSIRDSGSMQNKTSGKNVVPKDSERRLVPTATKVSDNPLIHAQWHGADDEKVRVDALGQDGRINWVISDLGSMETVNLALIWEVTVDEGLEIVTNLVDL